MKCEKCNEKEAIFFYKATINGETTQCNLCADCANESGLGSAFDWESGIMFSGFGYVPFGPSSMLYGAGFPFGARMPVPAALMPAFQPQALPVAEPERPIPEDAGEDIRTKRELTALRHQLAAAVKEENFESAIELRDRIKVLEK